MAQKLTVSNNGLELTNCLQQWLMENSETKKRSCYERLICPYVQIWVLQPYFDSLNLFRPFVSSK